MKLKKTIIFILIFLIFDLILTNIFIKNTYYWNQTNLKFFSKKEWRIKSNVYHHDLAKNISKKENWGSLEYKLVTNSLGFRDNIQRDIPLKKEDKKRIYINGDSFIEGVGYDYKDTVAGLIEDKLSDKYNILNSSVTSYSPSIYYRKTLFYLNKGLEFDYCFVFLDISDIPDENFIGEDDKGNIFDIREKAKENSTKEKIYYISRLYRDNFISGRFFAVLREITGSYKSGIKKKFLASKTFGKSFFDITNEEINLYKATHIDRSMWTFDKKYSDKWKENGLRKSSLYLKKLFKLLKDKNIESYLIIYPNPGQILLNKTNVNEEFWKEWSHKNNVKLINLYKHFSQKDKKEVIKEYFIPGDVHWNKNGHLFVFKNLEKEILDNF